MNDYNNPTSPNLT